ncbi:hypothetical protein D0W53_26010, partial [Salmonella enterica]|nr:hypothetical protein [Salmonella enterica]
MVVTLDPNGQPLSRYGDRSWDLRSMSTDGGQTSYSHTFLDAQPLSGSPEIGRPNLTALISEQQKALLWLHMDAGRQRALRTILQAGRTMNRLTQGAVSRGISLFEL